MLPLGQLLEGRALFVNTRTGDGVADPLNLNTLLLQGEKDDHGANSDGAGEGRRGDAEGVISTKLPIRGN